MDKLHDISCWIFIPLWFTSLFFVVTGYKYLAGIVALVSLLPAGIILYRVVVGAIKEQSIEDI